MVTFKCYAYFNEGWWKQPWWTTWSAVVDMGIGELPDQQVWPLTSAGNGDQWLKTLWSWGMSALWEWYNNCKQHSARKDHCPNLGMFESF